MCAKSRLGRGLDGLLGKGISKNNNNSSVANNSSSQDNSITTDKITDSYQQTVIHNENNNIIENNLNYQYTQSEKFAQNETSKFIENNSENNQSENKSTPNSQTNYHTNSNIQTGKNLNETRDLSDDKNTLSCENADKNLLREIDINKIIPSSSQARQDFDEYKIIELANSIKEGGLLQPIVVKVIDENKYMIIAGERRYRALKYLGKPTALVRIIASEEKESAILSLIENLQRESLNPVEEAQGFAHLASEFGLTQEQIAQKVGKARATVANAIRLLSLDKHMLSAVKAGKISVGHAKVLLSIDNLSKREEVFQAIITKDLNVRQTENLALLVASDHKPAPTSPKELSESLMKIEKQIAEQLTANVSLQHGSTKGKIVIEYKGEDELLRIANRIGIL